MKSKQNLEDLRDRADNILKNKGFQPDQEMLKADVSKLIEELSIHQIELELQRDELIIANENLKKEKSKYEFLFDFAPIGYITIDSEFNIIDANKTFMKLLNLSPTDLIGKPITNFVDKDFQDLFYLHVNKAKKNAKVTHSEILTLNIKNSSLDVQIRTQYKFTENNNDHLQIAFVDISEEVRKRQQLNIANKQLRISEEKYRILVENIPDVVWIADSKSRTYFISSNIEKLIGYSSEEILSNHEFWNSVTHPDDLLMTSTKYDDFFKLGSPYNVEYRIKQKNGNYIWVNDKALNISDDDDKKIAYGVLSEITTRKAAEIAERESKERLRSVLNSIDDLLFSIDKNGIFMDHHNPYTADKLIAQPEDFIGKHFTVVLPDELSQLVKKALEEIKTKGTTEQIKYCLKNNGRREWYGAKFSMWKNADGEFNGITALVRNETDRIEAENNLKETNERLDIALEGGHIAWWIWDFKTKQVHYDRRKPEMLGYTVEEFPTDVYKIMEYVHPEDYERAMNAMRKLLTGEKEEYLIDYRTKAKSGEYKWFYDRGKIVLRDENGDPHIISGAVVDITERKMMEFKLKETNATKDKLFSIIAHDIKNPFSSILNNTEHLLNNYSNIDDSEKLKLLKSIDSSSKYTYKLLENLLEWSRSQMGKIKYRPEILDIYELAFNSTFIFKQQAKEKDIEIVTNVAQNELVECDRNMINTVFRNLLSNAIKFSNVGGKIYIDSNSIDDELIISVKDEGVGMDQEEKESLFELNKNITKLGTNDEKGTGLGLIISKDFIEMNKGKIWVDSEKGKGSSFYFSLKKKN